MPRTASPAATCRVPLFALSPLSHCQLAGMPVRLLAASQRLIVFDALMPLRKRRISGIEEMAELTMTYSTAFIYEFTSTIASSIGHSRAVARSRFPGEAPRMA